MKGRPSNEKYAKLSQRSAKLSRYFYILLEFWDPSLSRERLKLETSTTFIKAYRSRRDHLSLVKFV